MISKSPRRPSGSATPPSSTHLPPSVLSTPEQVISYYSRLGLPVDNSIDIEEIIRRNSEITLVYLDLGINDAYIKKTSSDTFEIAINSKHHKNRQKFSMAHEYAHYLLHREKIASMPVGEQILHRNQDKNSVEYQANKFASELLMPSNLVRKALIKNNGSIKGAADHLGVSQEAFLYRAEALGYKVK
ncbi:ImmA/IrrE family metallo-endopeptidase [Brucella sp. 21LCYQ03]|nr:ImmA/IrrE family metallo-endopeptidase [Brucella sp. 21LCYQ03]